MHAAILAVLISQLGSPDFVTRERANAALSQLGPGAHSHLAIAEHSPDMEIRARARRLLDRWYESNAERLADEHGKMPWIDGNGSKHQESYYPLLERARQTHGIHGPPDWQDYREATRLLVIEMYRGRTSRVEVSRVLRDLWAAEREWKRMHTPKDLPE